VLRLVRSEMLMSEACYDRVGVRVKVRVMVKVRVSVRAQRAASAAWGL
jgi:hypothetical protein